MAESFMERVQEMGLHGLKVDVESLKAKVNSSQHIALMLKGDFYQEYGFDPNSRKLPIKGVTSTARDKLEAMIELGHEQSEMLQSIIDTRRALRRAQDLLGLLQRTNKFTGRINWEWTVAATDRLYATGALLTLSKEVRECIVPDSGQFVLYDYKQEELRVIAYLLGHAPMVNALMNGDIHAESADALGVTRDKAKEIHYALLYSFDMNYVQKAFKLTADQVERLLELIPFGNLYTLAEQRSANGFVPTAYGRLIPYDPGDAKQRTNYMIQGTGADILRNTLERLWHASKFPALVIHDAFLFDTADDEDLSPLISFHMGDMFFPVERKVGKTWADVT